MAEDRDALLQHYQQMRQELLDAIEGLSEDQMIEPSLDGWSIKDHLWHLALGDDIRATEIARISAGYESVWRLTSGQNESYNELIHSLSLALSLDQAKWELIRSGQRLLSSIALATPLSLDASLYRGIPLRSTHEAQHTGWIKRWQDERGI